MRQTSRLHWRIWLAVVSSLLVLALLAGTAWKLVGERHWASSTTVSDLASAVLPAADAPLREQSAALADWGAKLKADFALYDAQYRRIAATARDLPEPPATLPAQQVREIEFGRTFVVALADGRVLVARRWHPPARGPFGLIGMLVVIAAAVGVGTYPVVRRLTRRLEQLQSSVERLGGGDLSARVPVRGHDEVAALAGSFNEAAAQIERLVTSHRALLANASHELRSPLARVRMAVEMLKTDARPALKAELERDIAELDALIDEILLASRLDAAADALQAEDIDLTALAAEEAARFDARFEAEPVSLRGDARLVRRLIRNLLENARRHGGGPIDVELRRTGSGAELTVCDRGPGIPESERERVFEPFYRLAGSRESAGGVGLGLALVRQIAQRHGGVARCEARAGGGSCFRVRFPPAAAGAASR